MIKTIVLIFCGFCKRKMPYGQDCLNCPPIYEKSKMSPNYDPKFDPPPPKYN